MRLASYLVALLATCLSVGACGLLLTNGPPAGHESMDYFSCTESNLGPGMDAAWAGLNVVGALLSLTDDDAGGSGGVEGGAALVGLSWGALSGISAGVGFRRTSQCREAKAALAERVSPAGGASSQVVALVKTVSIEPVSISIEVGEHFQLVATALGSDGTVLTGQPFTWSSSNDAIASVDRTGTVTAHAPGAVVIAARAGGSVGVTNVTIEP